MSIETMKLALEALDVATTPLARDRQEVLRAQAALRAAIEQAEKREWQGLTENEIKHLWYEACQTNLELTSQLIVHLARNIEAKLREKNSA